LTDRTISAVRVTHGSTGGGPAVDPEGSSSRSSGCVMLGRCGVPERCASSDVGLVGARDEILKAKVRSHLWFLG
jgi:hypothetical protein